jgi:hypothetical protein
MRYEKGNQEKKETHKKYYLHGSVMGPCTGVQESGSDDATLASLWRLTLPMCEEFWCTRAVTAPIIWRGMFYRTITFVASCRLACIKRSLCARSNSRSQ